jgi:RNA polymerase sigma-70 factor (ECF subfamily)
VQQPDRINLIATNWTMIRKAHGEAGPDVRAAQEELFLRYGEAIRRYLLGALRNEDAADEVYQEFAWRFLNGRLQNADPERGRFRDYLKTTLSRMVVDYYRNSKRNKAQALDDALHAGADEQLQRHEEQFVENWRTFLLDKAWAALEAYQRESGKPFFTVLDIRRRFPEIAARDLVPLVSEALGEPISYGNLRQRMRRARSAFAELLIAEVEASLEDDNLDAVENELADLGLLPYCAPALVQRRGNR